MYATRVFGDEGMGLLGGGDDDLMRFFEGGAGPAGPAGVGAAAAAAAATPDDFDPFAVP